MILRTSVLTLLFSLAIAGHADYAQAAGRLAAFRAARAEAAASLQGPASAQPVQPMGEPVLVPAAVGTAVCCPQPCLIYRHRGHHRAGCGCAPPVEMVLSAMNPCTCCPVAIPVCVPACCQCAPSVSCHSGLFCAGVVDFDWSCGYRITVRFRHNGEVVVVTRG